MAPAPPSLYLTETRLSTFLKPRRGALSKCSWPYNPPRSKKAPLPPSTLHPSALSSAGFYHAPTVTAPLLVRCFLCDLEVQEWEEGDDPLALHLSLSPSCAWAIIKDTSWELEPVSDDEEEEEGSGIYPVERWSEKFGEKGEGHPRGERVGNARVESYKLGWIHEGVEGIPSSKDIADAGFYFRPGAEPESLDRSTCLYCARTVEGWEVGDDPIAIHKKRVGLRCPFFLAEDIVLDDDTPAPSVVGPTKSKSKRTTVVVVPSSPVAPPVVPVKAKATRGKKAKAVVVEEEVMEEVQVVEEEVVIPEEVDEEVQVVEEEEVVEVKPKKSKGKGKKVKPVAVEEVGEEEVVEVVEVPEVVVVRVKAKKSKAKSVGKKVEEAILVDEEVVIVEEEVVVVEEVIVVEEEVVEEPAQEDKIQLDVNEVVPEPEKEKKVKVSKSKTKVSKSKSKKDKVEPEPVEAILEDVVERMEDVVVSAPSPPQSPIIIDAPSPVAPVVIAPITKTKTKTTKPKKIKAVPPPSPPRAVLSATVRSPSPRPIRALPSKLPSTSSSTSLAPKPSHTPVPNPFTYPLSVPSPADLGLSVEEYYTKEGERVYELMKGEMEREMRVWEQGVSEGGRVLEAMWEDARRREGRQAAGRISIVEKVPTSTVKLDPTHLHILHFSPPHEFPALPLPPHLATMYSTHTYKTISSSLSLSADVYLPAPSAPSGDAAPLLPVLAWFHGGGLLMGSRSSIPPHLLRAVENSQLCLVSFDYRLAPQAGVDAIVSDVRSAGAWLRESLSEVTGGRVDVERIAVGGGSAGGYLALLAGSKKVGWKVAPKAILAVYPITNPQGPFFKTKQSPTVGTDGRVITHESMKEHVDPAGEVRGFYKMGNGGEGDRIEIYSYMCQEAILEDLLFVNAAPGIKREDYIPATFVDSDFPPTYIFHGTIDNRVGIEQSYTLVDALKKEGVKYQFEECVGGGQHLFDYQPEVQMEQMWEFWGREMA